MKGLIMVAGLASCLTLSALDIVKDGKAQAEIIVSHPQDAEIMLAARDLQENLMKISGAELTICTSAQIEGAAKICIGESEYTRSLGYVAPEFKSSGYDIWVKGNCVVLNGPCSSGHRATALEEKGLSRQNRYFTLEGEHLVNEALQVSLDKDCGPMHAVSAFLENLGVRFYGPAEEDTVRPSLKNISLQEGRETVEAAFARREYQYGEAQKADADGVRWLKRLKGGSSAERIGMLPLASILLEDNGAHPQWLGKDKFGKRLISLDANGVPRYLEPGFQEACLKRIREIFDGAPELTQIILVPPAFVNGWDYADWTKMYRDEEYSQPIECDLTLEFFMQLAKELRKTHPGRKLLWQGTGGNRMFSEDNVKRLPENIGAASNHYAAINYANNNNRGRYLKNTEALHKAFPGQPLQQREWWNEFACPCTPRQEAWFMHNLQAVRQMQSQNGFAGFLMDLAPDAQGRGLAELPLTHLMIYVNSKLLWNPNLDLEALLDEYCSLYFGPAASVMRTFLTYAESVASRKYSRSICLKNGQLQQDDIPVFFDMLAKAKANVAAGSLYFKRIQKIEDSFAWMKTAFSEREATGEKLDAEILSRDIVCDGNLDKYKNWMPLKSADGKVAPGNRTEIAVAFTEDRTRLMLAFRCYDEKMSAIKSFDRERDDMAIDGDDHVKVQFFTNKKTGMMVIANASGSILDASSDPTDVSNRGTAFGWNSSYTAAKVKRLADRWELELSIGAAGCGNAPDWKPAWGFNVSRVRMASGKPEVQALVPGEAVKPCQWRQLVLAPRNVAGEEVNKGGSIIRQLPGTVEDFFYVVKKAPGNVEFCKGWEEGAWKGVKEMRLGFESYEMGSTVGSFIPDARAKVLYDDKYIYVQYQVKDCFVRGGIYQDQDQVCTDSCMEFFIRPNGDGNYFNFECNCSGTLLLYNIAVHEAGLDFNPMDAETLLTVERFHSLPRPQREEIKTPVTWYLGLKIPLDLFVQNAGVTLPLTGQVWTANVLKCADRTSNPVWLMWHRSWAFHAPEDFGKLIFE